jgi:hypothetical protein
MSLTKEQQRAMMHIINSDARKMFADAIEECGEVRADQVKAGMLEEAQMGQEFEGDTFFIDIYDSELYECRTALYGSEKEYKNDLDIIMYQCNDKKKLFKVPCSWEMYGEMEVVAENWDDAVSKAEEPERTLPTNGSYVEASFRIDHDMVEMNKEDYEEGEEI